MRLIDADALEKEYRRQFDAVYKNIRDTVLPSDFYVERKAAYDKEIVRQDMEAFCEFLHSRPSIDTDAYFDAVDRIKPCPKCRYQIFGGEPVITGEISDGYHTFNELYHHRAVLFSVIVKAFPDMAWKSRQHHDGSMYDGMFIVGIETPDGSATYHYDLKPYWDMFRCKEIERAPEWDGHTADAAIERIGKLEPVRHGRWIDMRESSKDVPHIRCSECKSIIYGLESRYCPNCGAKMDLEVHDDGTRSNPPA